VVRVRVAATTAASHSQPAEAALATANNRSTSNSLFFKVPPVVLSIQREQRQEKKIKKQ
jgi:hypothetical protein